jgi:hypothetical protein
MRMVSRVGHHTAGRRIPLVRQHPRPGGGVIAGEHDSHPGTPYTADLDPHPGSGLQVTGSHRFPAATSDDAQAGRAT